MEENVVQSLQTTAQNNNNNTSNNIGQADEHNRNIEASDTDILYKYQQAHERRIKNGQNNSQKPTKRYGESIAGHNTNTTGHPTCLRESLYLLFAWLGYVIHITFFLLPNSFFNGETTLTDFYNDYSIEIAPANWNSVQFGIQLLWQGILLTYLSLIIAEHTIKIFPKGFYYGLGLANTCLGIWDICTEHKSYLGRAISWLTVAICLFYSNYRLLKHIYCDYDVTKYVPPSKFRLDSMPSDNDIDQIIINPNDSNNQLAKSDEMIPPLTINNNNNNNNNNTNDKSVTGRNINAIMGRIKTGGSLNNSPISMSMAPSAAQKLVYDAANAANLTDNDWLETKITDVTRLKYTGLIGIVFNGISYFLSVVCINFWVQMGVWLVYGCKIDDNIASAVALVFIFICILIYYFFDFYYFQKYFVDNFATHIVCCVTFAAMIWRHLFGNDQDDKEELSNSFSQIFQMIIFFIVVIATLIKVIITIRIHRKYKRSSDNENNNDYKRVI